MITKAYSSVTKLAKEPHPSPESDENIAAVAEQMNWLASSPTQRMVAAIVKDVNQLLADAADLAMINHQQENSKLIVQKLVEAKTLQKVLSRYVKVSNQQPPSDA